MQEFAETVKIIKTMWQEEATKQWGKTNPGINGSKYVAASAASFLCWTPGFESK
jgi:hypothetical protein